MGGSPGHAYMRPLTVITGIVLGSCASIAVSLAAVFIMFLLLADDHPRVAAEFPSMGTSLALFAGMTAVAGASFYALVMRHRWWLAAQLLMWVGLAGTGWYYYP